MNAYLLALLVVNIACAVAESEHCIGVVIFKHLFVDGVIGTATSKTQGLYHTVGHMPLFGTVAETLFGSEGLVDKLALFSAVGILPVPWTGSSIGIFKVIRSLEEVALFRQEHLGVGVGGIFY